MRAGRMRTRPAVAADAEAVALLHAESWRVAYRGMLRDDYLDREIYRERQALWEERFAAPAPNQHVIVAEVGETVAGFACVYGAHDARWGSFLDNLHVGSEHKRHGIGSALMREVAQWSLKSWPQIGLYLWVLESNTPAIRFYESQGGRLAGQGQWEPPDGGEYCKLRYAWDDVRTLLQSTPR
jgi:ribosomal protein S18 acetylase RimI-like enzyme